MNSPSFSLQNQPTRLDSETRSHPGGLFQYIAHWDASPRWMQADPYIRRGYRRQLNSFAACFRSLFYLHNEFVNIWSHLVPAIFYLNVLAGVDWGLFDDQSPIEARQASRREDVAMVQLYIAGIVILLLASAFFHGTSAHSEAMTKRLLKLDYVGICVGISVTNLSSTYFGLYDKPWLLTFYNTFCVLCSFSLLALLMRSNADGSGAAFSRVLTFVALMLSGVAPIVHMFIVEGLNGIERFPIMPILYMELFYFVGTIFYLSHWPEKQWPETFDIWASTLPFRTQKHQKRS